MNLKKNTVDDKYLTKGRMRYFREYILFDLTTKRWYFMPVIFGVFYIRFRTSSQKGVFFKFPKEVPNFVLEKLFENRDLASEEGSAALQMCIFSALPINPVDDLRVKFGGITEEPLFKRCRKSQRYESVSLTALQRDLSSSFVPLNFSAISCLMALQSDLFSSHNTL